MNYYTEEMKTVWKHKSAPSNPGHIDGGSKIHPRPLTGCFLCAAGRVRSPPLRRWGSVVQPRWPGCRSATRPTRRRVTIPSRSQTASRSTPGPLTCLDKVATVSVIFVRRHRLFFFHTLFLYLHCSSFIRGVLSITFNLKLSVSTKQRTTKTSMRYFDE